jgi:hypothetical protein
MPAKHGLLQALKQKQELLPFGYVTQWETFRRSDYTRQVLCHWQAQDVSSEVWHPERIGVPQRPFER